MLLQLLAIAVLPLAIAGVLALATEGFWFFVAPALVIATFSWALRATTPSHRPT
jgi:hypothetical protein